MYSGIYEGQLDFYFGDGASNEIGKIYLDLSKSTPILYYDGANIKNVEIDGNTLKATHIAYFEIKLSDELNGSTILFNDEFYTNNGKDFIYPLKKIGNISDVQLEIENFRKENELFSNYWKKFLISARLNNYDELVKNLNYPLVDKCSGELYGTEKEAIKKLKAIINSNAGREIDSDSESYRLPDYYVKMFEGRWYIQRNGSIFFNIVDGEIKIVSFNCGFG